MTTDEKVSQAKHHIDLAIELIAPNQAAELVSHFNKKVDELREQAKDKIFQLLNAEIKNGNLTDADKEDLANRLLHGGRKAVAKKSKASAPYADPDHKENTWGGRGRKPKWLEEALNAGRKLDEFKVVVTE